MRRHVVLDTGVLGLVTHPSQKLEPRDCKEWLETLLHKGASVYVPEIADYELRRELLRLDMSRAVARLDSLKSVIGYLPITTAAMMKAAEFWASARKAGIPTADPKALDADVILAHRRFYSPAPVNCPSLRPQTLSTSADSSMLGVGRTSRESRAA